MDMLDGLPSRPHEWLNMVAQGYNQYEYSAKKLKETKDTHRNGIIYQAQAETDKCNDFASLAEQLGNQVSMNINTLQNQLAAPEKNKSLSQEDKQLVD